MDQQRKMPFAKLELSRPIVLTPAALRQRARHSVVFESKPHRLTRSGHFRPGIHPSQAISARSRHEVFSLVYRAATSPKKRARVSFRRSHRAYKRTPSLNIGRERLLFRSRNSSSSRGRRGSRHVLCERRFTRDKMAGCCQMRECFADPRPERALSSLPAPSRVLKIGSAHVPSRRVQRLQQNSITENRKIAIDNIAKLRYSLGEVKLVAGDERGAVCGGGWVRATVDVVGRFAGAGADEMHRADRATGSLWGTS